MAGTAVADLVDRGGQRLGPALHLGGIGGAQRSGFLAHRVELGEHLGALLVRLGPEAPEDHVRSVDEDVQPVGGVGDRLGGGGDRRRIGSRRGDEVVGRRAARVATSSSTGASAVWASATTALSTLELTRCTASSADTTTPTSWIGSSLSWRISDLGSFPGEHAVQRIGREDHHDVDFAVGERSSSRVLVGGEPLGVDEAFEHLLVLSDGVFVHRRRRSDEQRAQLELLAAVSDAEQQQHDERPEDQESQEPRLANDLDELLAHEREALDDARPGTVDRQPARRPHEPAQSVAVAGGCSAVPLDDLHERFVVVHLVAGQLDDRDAAAAQRLADRCHRVVGVVDDDPPQPWRDLPWRRDDTIDCSHVRQRTGLDALGHLDVDHVAAEGCLPQPLGRVEHQELAVAEHADEVAVGGLPDVLRRDDDRASLIAQLAEALPELGPEDRVDARRGLVEEDDRRVVDERRGERQAALHAAGDLVDPLVAVLVELHPLEQLVQPAPPAQPHAVQRGVEVEVLPHRQIGEQRRESVAGTRAAGVAGG